MAFKFSELDAKTRVLIVFGSIIGVAIAAFFGVRYFSGNKGAAGSHVAGAPSNLQSVPGSQLTAEYYRTLQQSNAERTKQAQMTGGSAVPTLMAAPAAEAAFTQPVQPISENCGVVCPNPEIPDVSNDINDLVKAGTLPQTDADKLLRMAKQNVPVSEYEDELNELVKEGKLTPEQARKLLAEYKKQHANALLTESGKAMDALIKSGQLPLDVANQLLALQKSGVTPAAYAAELQRLVKEGKISPATAEMLLGQYKQQQQDEATKANIYDLNKAAHAGAITAEVAKDLADLQTKNVPVDQYAAELQRLVAEGKLTPEEAAKLLSEYKAKRASLGAPDALNGVVSQESAAAASLLDNMVKAGVIPPDAAKELQDLQNKNASPEEYEAALNELVKEGKLTPAQAAALLASYKKLHAAKLSGNKQQIEEAEKELAHLLQAQGQPITQETANKLLALQNKDVSPEEYQAAIDELVKEGKLTPEQAAQLMASYRKLHAVKAEAKQLAEMQSNNASPVDYANELKRAVAAGVLTPEEATALMQEYQAMATAPTAPIATTSALPGNSDFARLAQQVQAAQAQNIAPTLGTVEFTPPPKPTGPSPQELQAAAEAAKEAEQERLQRIQQLQSAMSGQAQALIAAWQPPRMEHVGGYGGEVKAETTSASALSTVQSKIKGATSAGGASTASTGAPLIKTGTIYFAVLDTAVDSDYPDTPVMATIVQGPFKGCKLLGKLALATGKDKVSLNFNLMDKEDWPKTKSINAFAIDPDTARTVMASSVDYHYLDRYGGLMAASFLQGYSSSITQAGTSTTGIFGTSTTHPSLSPLSRIAVGLGQIGQTLNANMQQNLTIPNTVKVNAGVALGILFMSDVSS